MSTDKNSMSIRWFRFRHLVLPSIAAFGLLSAVHAADVTDGFKVTVLSGKESYSRKVSITDLDLSTAAGYRVANERVQAAVKQVCLRAVDARDRSSRHNYLSCVDASSAGVVPQLQHLADVSRNAHALARN